MSRTVTTSSQSFPVRLDVLLGALTGFGVALAFGGSIFGALGSAWQNVVLPAFYNLSQTGLPFCG